MIKGGFSPLRDVNKGIERNQNEYEKKDVYWCS